MVTATTAPAPAPQGHCSQCGKVWVLNEAQGVCPWCGKSATCQQHRTQALRSIKSRGKRYKTQASANGNGHNGYDQLEGKWLVRYKVASKFAHKAKPYDTEDLLHTIILRLALAEQRNGHKPFTEAVMYRIASHTVADYWFNHYKVNNGLDCQHCSKAQRQKCKEKDLYRECPKAIKLGSLNKPVIDSEGNLTEFGELIADDKAMELGAWVSETIWQLGYKPRLVAIAQKLHIGDKLDWRDYKYLERYRQSEQKKLL